MHPSDGELRPEFPSNFGDPVFDRPEEERMPFCFDEVRDFFRLTEAVRQVAKVYERYLFLDASLALMVNHEYRASRGTVGIVKEEPNG